MNYHSKALKLKEDLDKLRPISTDQEAKIMQKLRLDWNYHSNSLEGNSLTFGETRALILEGITAHGKPFKDAFEIEGHNEALELVEEIIKKDYPLTEAFIRDLHKLILKKPYEVQAITLDGNLTTKTIEIGKYKTSPNHVRRATGQIFYFSTPQETPAKMHDLMNWYKSNHNLKNIDPIVFAAEFHHKFVKIHPFDDGNGRLARILMNFILMQFGFTPAIIKTEDKARYFNALAKADTGEIEDFIEYISKSLCNSLKIMIKGAKGENFEDDIDWQKELSLLARKKIAQEKNQDQKDEEIKSIFIKKAICEIFQHIQPLRKNFENFYQQINLSFVIKFSNKDDLIEEDESIIIDHINEKTSELLIKYEYKNFSSNNIISTDFLSCIILEFNHDNYIICDSKKSLIIEKKYNEILTKEEINSILKIEAQKHLNFIKEKI